MRYAVNNWIYGDEPLRDTFTRLSRYGYDGIEFVGEPSRFPVSEVLELSEEFGITPTSVLGWCVWGIPGRDMASPDDAERKAAIRYGQQCIDFAAEIGVPIVIVIPAAAGRTAPTGRPKTESEWHSGYQAEWGHAVDSIRQAAAYAAERNILLALEPINRYETFLVVTLDQGLQFISDVGVDNLKLNLDTFHMNIEEPNLADAVRRAGDLLVSMHVSDSNRQAPGRGHMDYTTLLGALGEIDYQGTLVLEPVPPGSDPILLSQFPENLPLRDIYAEESINYLRQIEQAL
jgi:sugar phosphate isomerase/epimerase